MSDARPAGRASYLGERWPHLMPGTTHLPPFQTGEAPGGSSLLLRGPSLGFCVRARGVSGSCPHLHVDASRGQEPGRGSRARGLPTTGAASGLTLRCCWVLCRVIGGLGVATGGRGQPAGGPQRQRQEAGAPPSRSCGDPCSQWLRRGHGFLGPHGPGPVPSALGGGGHVRGLGKRRPRTPAPAWLQQRNRGGGCERIWQDLKPPTSPTVTSVPSAGPRPASRRRRCGLTPRAWGPRRPLPALPAGQEGGSQRHAVLGRHFLEGASSREGREGLIPSAEGPCSAAPRREARGLCPPSPRPPQKTARACRFEKCGQDVSGGVCLTSVLLGGIWAVSRGSFRMWKLKEGGGLHPGAFCPPEAFHSTLGQRTL